jgi:hypothetical protein
MTEEVKDGAGVAPAAPKKRPGAPRGPRRKKPLAAAPAPAEAAIPGMELLTADEIAAAKQAGIADVEAELKASAIRAIQKNAAEGEKRKRGLLKLDKQPRADEEMVSFTVDLAEHAPYVRLDNQTYYHGHPYTVPTSVYRTIAEVMSRTYDHQAEIDGKSENSYRRSKDTHIGGKTGRVHHAGLAR